MVDRVFDLTVGDVGNAGQSFDFLFHAGEPMTIGLDRMRDIVDRCIAKAKPGVDFRFSIQTNGVLINDGWAQFFREYRFAVGVSIDGPAFLHDTARRNWGGRGTHAKAVRGVRILQQHGMDEVGCLAVVGKEALGHADAIMDFFIDLGIAAVGFNLEDVENANLVTSFGPDRARLEEEYKSKCVVPFLERVFDRWWPVRHRLRVREFADVLRAAALIKADDNYSRTPDAARELGILTIMKDGQISTFAPEFAGAKAPEYNDFVIGHVEKIERIGDLRESPSFRKLSRDVNKGISACRAECEYYPLCGGSYVSNRYFEYRDLSRASTFSCTMMRKGAADVCFARLTRANRPVPD